MAQSRHLDSLDLLHTELYLEVTDFSGETLSGVAELEVRNRKASVQTLPLMLYRGFDVARVEIDSRSVVFARYGDSLVAPLPAQSAGDTHHVRIEYAGTPQRDAQWGGFYWREGYAFNLGVAFTEIPHPFGRSWYPAIDAFEERSQYAFHVTTPEGKKAFLSGMPDSTTTDAQNRPVWHWSTRRPIPSYLVGIAVGPYTTREDAIERANGPDLPMIHGVAAADTARYFGAFSKLKAGFRAFEQRYGAYRFPRIGYAVVPFRQGAMEHSTNIAYPDNALDEDVRSERLWAHELSHAWWGNLVTCRSSADMWLNEGFASYSEMLFLEALYGRDTYLEAVADNHRNFLRYGAYLDGGPRPISPMPNHITYGRHVYDKGADILHNLRTYMGDSAFFQGLRHYLQRFAFSTASSSDLRESLEQQSGLDLTDFFETWIYQPGYLHYQMDSFRMVKAGSSVRLYLSRIGRNRKLDERSAQATDVVPVVLFQHHGASVSRRLRITRDADSVDFTAPSGGVTDVFLDPQGMMSDATTDFADWVSGGDFSSGLELPMTFSALRDLQTKPDSVFLHVSHHWVGAEQADAPEGVLVSPERYWQIQWNGAAQDVQAGWLVSYNGNTSLRDATSLLDTALLEAGTEDSLVLMYRPHASSSWSAVPEEDIRYLIGDPQDGKGLARVEPMRQGMYCWAMKGVSTQSWKAQNGYNSFRVSPNPATNSFRAAWDAPQSGLLTLLTMNGQSIRQWKFSNRSSVERSVSDLAAGIYILRLEQGHRTDMRRLVVSD